MKRRKKSLKKSLKDEIKFFIGIAIIALVTIIVLYLTYDVIVEYILPKKTN